MTTAEFEEQNLGIELQKAFDENGFMDSIAQTALEEPVTLTSTEIADIIVPRPPTGESLPERWQLLVDAKSHMSETAAQHEDDILVAASRTGMRHDEALSESDLVRIQPDAAIWTVEGGANRTSIVRRTLAIQAMQRIYGEDVSSRTLFQFGGGRPIPREKNGKPNPEMTIAREIAPDFLPSDDSLVEFGLNLASALQSGYEVINDERDGSAAERLVFLYQAGFPELVLVYPHKTEKGGLEDGFSAIAGLVGSLEGRQFVIATNGQYRPKDEAQADQWAKAHDLDMLPPVALGDEPGYSVNHKGQEITTAKRGPMVYVNEFVVLQRLLQED
jgi:hypothetical protein